MGYYGGGGLFSGFGRWLGQQLPQTRAIAAMTGVPTEQWSVDWEPTFAAAAALTAAAVAAIPTGGASLGAAAGLIGQARGMYEKAKPFVDAAKQMKLPDTAKGMGAGATVTQTKPPMGPAYTDVMTFSTPPTIGQTTKPGAAPMEPGRDYGDDDDIDWGDEAEDVATFSPNLGM